MSDSLWYKDAIIYELHVKTFHDSDADGIGDFRGLMEKLDYLQELGISAIWLLPFYPSPLKDDGYAIANYLDVNPNYGTLDDFRAFLDAAHERGLRVITELVINHTSDQNPWFQKSRRAPPGSPEREVYVWSDNPEKYKDARIIFKDFETSNWSWDPIAKSYYWHRFYSHQPDLNFDNPAVHEVVERVCDFWLKLGVDGVRLDAIPYLYEREGTNCENLPETHVYLKKLRAHIDAQFSGRMLLAEANQWPEDAVAYFGNGDEAHMNFHFPLMPRLFMSIRMEDRFPIVDILAQTPPVPETTQWALFLRNHDELTLEMVTDEERDYMYRSYTQDRAARLNLGIRRRLDARAAAAREPQGAGVRAPVGVGADSVRGQPLAISAGGRAGPQPLEGPGADRAVRVHRAAPDRRHALLPHPRAPFLLLVLAGAEAVAAAAVGWQHHRHHAPRDQARQWLGLHPH